jgi:hypothetical protein
MGKAQNQKWVTDTAFNTKTSMVAKQVYARITKYGTVEPFTEGLVPEWEDMALTLIPAEKGKIDGMEMSVVDINPITVAFSERKVMGEITDPTNVNAVEFKDRKVALLNSAAITLIPYLLSIKEYIKNEVGERDSLLIADDMVNSNALSLSSHVTQATIENALTLYDSDW